MDIFHNWYKRIFVLSALIAISLQSQVYQIIKSVTIDSYWANIVISILSTAALYTAIQKLIIFIYEKIGWKILLRRYNIEGQWYHVLRVQSETDYVRLGSTTILQSVNDISINAYNVNQDFNYNTVTLWNSNSVSINKNGRIIFSYKATRTTTSKNDNIYDKDGIMDVQIICEGGKPTQLIGKFQDSFPSNRRGSVIWLRDVKWQDKLKNEIDNF